MVPNNLTFGGYFAAPYKAVYLRPHLKAGYLTLARELQHISRTEELDMDVLLQVDDQLLPPEQVPLTQEGQINTENQNPWSQDGRCIVSTPQGEKLVITRNGSSLEAREEIFSGEALADALGIPSVISNTFQDPGGNFWIGKDKRRNEFFALFGEAAIETSRPALEKLHEIQSGFRKHARQFASKVYSIKPENVHFLSQANFHNDMSTRPLSYPYVLVHDPKLSKELLDKAIKTSADPAEIKQLQALQSHMEPSSKKYAPTDVIERRLRKYGLEVIRVPGVFGDLLKERRVRLNNPEAIFEEGYVNFINALTPLNRQGQVVYITGASHLPTLNRLFKEKLLALAPQSKLRFVTGGPSDAVCPGQNLIMDALRKQGGLHCLLTEHPDFKRWA